MITICCNTHNAISLYSGIQANEPNDPHNRDMFWKMLFEKYIAEGILFSMITILFKPGSSNCESDEAGVSWSISFTNVRLLSSQQNVFVIIS